MDQAQPGQETVSEVTFVSYNSTGLGPAKIEWFKDLLELTNCTFGNIQEHFQSQFTGKRKTVGKASEIFSDNFPTYKSFVVPAKRGTGVSRGRAAGGLAQLTSNSVGVMCERLASNNDRIQAQIIQFQSCRLFWSNVYLPTDTRERRGEFDDTELLQVLSDIEQLMDNNQNSFDHALICGDWNFDPSRQSGFAEIVREFNVRCGLVSTWESFEVDHTHIHTDYKSTSILDHFMVNEALLPFIADCGPLHLGDNLSRHSPIMLILNVGDIPVKEPVVPPALPKRPAWYKAENHHLNNYKGNLSDKLDQLTVPPSIDCRDPHCQSPDHKQERDCLMLDVLSCICDAAKEEIPLSGGGGQSQGTDAYEKVIPGWREQIAPHKETANFWHSLWISAGKPVQGEVYNIMKRTRNQYHYQIRRVKLLADQIRSNKLLEASLSGNSDLLKEMKRVKSSGKVNQPDHVDKKTGANIPEQFANVYEALYNSVNDDQGLEELRRKLLAAGISASDTDNITPEIVKQAVNKIKSGKTDVSGQFSSDALLNAPDNLFCLLSSLFKAFFIHEDFTFDIMCCAFMPLLKGALKDDTNSNNYRAIAISALLLKVLDNVILILYGDNLQSGNLQFGYKKNTSGTQCSWMVLEVVQHYFRHNTTVKAAWLDCSRAFDTCVFSILFTKILDRGVPAIIVRGLLAIYTQQRCWVKWSANQTVSRVFGVSNSTRQGSCLSPCIFCVYLDGLLIELRDAGVGCVLGDFFVGAACFADDLALLAPTRDGLQTMLDITADYARRHNLSFSTDPIAAKSKSKAMFFHVGREPNPAPVKLCGRILPWVERADHLGHVMHYTASQDLDTNSARGSYIGTSNEILNMFSFATPAQKLTAVQTYACAWYGSMLWSLYSEAANKAFRSWNTTIKMAYNLPRQTRTFYLDNYLCPLPSVRQMIIRRYVQYISVDQISETANRW